MPISQRTKRTVTKIVFIALSVFFVALIGVIFFKGGVMRSYKAVIKENLLTMKGIKLVYILDNTSYINLFAENGYADRDNNSVAMQDVKIEYNGSGTKIDASADNGQYELERFVNVYGNVKGIINDMRFDAGENGSMTYDYKDGKGEVRKGVTIYQGNNSIHADSINFDSKESFVLFRDNVTVDYIIGPK